MKGAFYNEHDPCAAQWLRELIKTNNIAPGDVDERSIEDIPPTDLFGYGQVHLFGGIGVWSYALRLAGIGDDLPYWTCSCPCQPFSSAGKGDGFGDERHLWPAAFHLIRECRPSVCFGEQVASDDGYAWLDLVQTDLEGVGYTVGAVVTPAAGYGAPHGRHRIYWVAHTRSDGRERWPGVEGSPGESSKRREAVGNSRDCGVTGELEHTHGNGCGRGGSGEAEGTSGGVQGEGGKRERIRADIRPASSPIGELADNKSERRKRGAQDVRGRLEGSGSEGVRGGSAIGAIAVGVAHGATVGNANCPRPQGRGVRLDKDAAELAIGSAGAVGGFWGDADWIHCAPEPGYPGGRWRPVMPGAFPLAHGATARMVKLRGFGNAIVATQAAEFIKAFLQIEAKS